MTNVNKFETTHHIDTQIEAMKGATYKTYGDELVLNFEDAEVAEMHDRGMWHATGLKELGITSWDSTNTSFSLQFTSYEKMNAFAKQLGVSFQAYV